MTAELQPDSKSSSRRALLAGALGGIGAWAASAIGRPASVHGANGDPVLLGQPNDETGPTRISNSSTSTTQRGLWVSASGDATAIFGDSQSGVAIQGQAPYGTAGVVGTSVTGHGVYGLTDATSGASAGVYGQANDQFGVYGQSVGDVGVRGASTNFLGVYGQSTNNDGILGVAIGAKRGVRGESAGGTGTYGFSGPYGTGPAVKAKTGVYGYANQDSSAKGIFGESAKGFAGYFAGKVYLSKFQEMKEISTPQAPGANKARLFLKDNGAGKTQLCVRFNSGAVQILATQP